MTAAGRPTLPQPGDAFGEEVTLTAKTIVFSKGSANWDSAFETLIDSFKTVNECLRKAGDQAGRPADDDLHLDRRHRLRVQAGVPVAEAPKGPLPDGDIAVANRPSGKTLKFVHRGSYDAMDTTYEAITNYLDEKHLEARETRLSKEYVTDPVTTPGRTSRSSTCLRADQVSAHSPPRFSASR